MHNPIEFEQLSKAEQDEIVLRSAEWADNHWEHVTRLIESATACVAPSGSDLNHPELWKAIHWLWFWSQGYLDE